MISVFYHIPKTAGSAFRSLFKLNYTDDRIIEAPPLLGQMDEFSRSFGGAMHPNFQGVIYGHFPYKLGLPEGLASSGNRGSGVFEFTIVREPLSRMISEANFAARSPFHGYHKTARAIECPVERVLRLFEIPYYQNLTTRYLSGELGIPLLTESSLQKALSAVESLDFVGTLERIEESVLIISKLLSWKNPIMDMVNVGEKITVDVYQELAKKVPEPYLFMDRQVYACATKKLAEMCEQGGGVLQGASKEYKVISDYLTSQVKDKSRLFSKMDQLDSEAQLANETLDKDSFIKRYLNDTH